MPINQLHGTFKRSLAQLRPAERITRVRNWSRLLVGLCLSRSVHLSKIASKIPTTEATLPSATRRLSRLLDNPAIRVRDWYEPIARSLLERAAQGGGEVRLIVDGSKVGFGHRLLMVGLAYRRRAIAIAWGAGCVRRRAIALLTSNGRFWTTCVGVCYLKKPGGFRWSVTANSGRSRPSSS